MAHRSESRSFGEQDDANTVDVRWDVLFLLKNYPVDYRLQGPHFRTVDLGEASVKAIAKATRKKVGASVFFSDTDFTQLRALVFRVYASNQSDAIDLARHRLDALLDGVSLVLDRNLPKVWPFVQIRRDEDPSSYLVETRGDDWAYFNANDESSNIRWQEQQRELFTSLLSFFDIAMSLHPSGNSPLSRQLLYSMKMFRHGAMSGIFGLEYLCKWSALEGMICGGEQGKKRLLLTRLPMLFPTKGPEFLETLSKLWNIRNEAIHESRAFDSDHLPEAPALGPHIETVEFLFRNVVIFALSRIAEADSVESLWRGVETYKPITAIQERPADMPRMAMKKFIMPIGVSIKNGGTLIDSVFASQQNAPAPK
jgi:hypothetical protein